MLSAGLAVWAVQTGAIETEPAGPAVWVDYAHLDPTVPYVRTSGMAHYEVVVQQHVPAALFHEAETYYLYGLFEPYDTETRAIRVMVRTKVKPETLVSYELMTLEGRLSRATPDKVTYDVEIKLGERSDYYFADDMLLLEPTVVESGLDPRVAPEPVEDEE